MRRELRLPAPLPDDAARILTGHIASAVDWVARAVERPLLAETHTIARRDGVMDVTIRVDDAEVRTALRRLRAAVDDLRPAMREIRGGPRPVPWGDVPARPFLGVPDEGGAIGRQSDAADGTAVVQLGARARGMSL